MVLTPGCPPRREDPEPLACSVMAQPLHLPLLHLIKELLSFLGPDSRSASDFWLPLHCSFFLPSASERWDGVSCSETSPGTMLGDWALEVGPAGRKKHLYSVIFLGTSGPPHLSQGALLYPGVGEKGTHLSWDPQPKHCLCPEVRGVKKQSRQTACVSSFSEKSRNGFQSLLQIGTSQAGEWIFFFNRWL